VCDAALCVCALLLAADMLFFTESEPGKGTAWSQIRRKFAGPANGEGG
jgi:hypothetical protein